MAQAQKKKPAKKRPNVRVVMTNLFMVISVVAIASALTLVAMGYRIEGGGLTQYGLLQVKSSPSGAGVEIDNEKAETTEMSKMLPDGDHDLIVTKPGYDVWRSKISIKSGLLTRVDWVRLFPIERTGELVNESDDMTFISATPTRNALLVGRSGAVWSLIENVDGRAVTVRDIAIPEWAIGKEISARKWNQNGDKLFVRIDEEWSVISMQSSTESINISQKFSMVFSSIALANNSGDKLYVLENGNIRVVDLRSGSVSDVKVAGVTSIGGAGESIGYTQSVEGKSVVGLYSDTSQAGTEIFQPTGTSASVRSWQYWGEDVIVGVFDGRLIIQRGDVHEKMTEVVNLELGDIKIDTLSVSPSGRFLATGSKVIDITTGIVHEAEVGSWLDDFMMYAVRDQKLAVWDFTGENRREIGEAGAGEVMISRGDGWLYYKNLAGSGILREKL